MTTISLFRRGQQKEYFGERFEETKEEKRREKRTVITNRLLRLPWKVELMPQPAALFCNFVCLAFDCSARTCMLTVHGHVRVAAASKRTCVHKGMLHVFELDTLYARIG